MLLWESYPELTRPGLRHAFSLRTPAVPDARLHAALHPSISSLGWKEEAIVEADQPHGKGVAVVGLAEAGKTIPGVDALVTTEPGVVLAIRAADCGPVWVFDPVRKALGLIHSGRKGTELNIVGATIAVMEGIGCQPENLLVFLGPCIRPPNYETPFAAEIGFQAMEAGAGEYTDSGLDTAERLDRYYSYRAEKGKTGRMWAVGMLDPDFAP
jgi:hypothetical protein